MSLVAMTQLLHASGAPAPRGLLTHANDGRPHVFNSVGRLPQDVLDDVPSNRQASVLGWVEFPALAISAPGDYRLRTLLLKTEGPSMETLGSIDSICVRVD